MQRRSKYTKIPQLNVACTACKKVKEENVDNYEKEAQDRISYDEKNIDKSRSYLNLFVHGFDEKDEPIIDNQKYEDSLKDRIMERINEVGAKIIHDKREVKRAKSKKEYYTDRGHNTRESVIAEGIIFQLSHELAMKMLEEDGMLDENGKIREGATIPKDGKIWKWIADTYKFACEKWGKENVVGAYFHLDEYTPHLHTFVVPLEMRECTYAKKPVLDEAGNPKRKGVLNAKTIFSPESIKRLWPEYAEAMKSYGATAAKGIIPKERYDNVASMTQMARNLENSIKELEEKEINALINYQEVEADVVIIQGELSGLKEEKKEYEEHKSEYAQKKEELKRINAQIEELGKDLRYTSNQLFQKRKLLSSLNEAEFKKYMNELPSRINTEIRQWLYLRGVYRGYSVIDVGKVDGDIAIRMADSKGKSIIIKIYPNGKGFANGALVTRRDGSPQDFSEIVHMFSDINPAAREFFDSIFLRQGHAIAGYEHMHATRMPAQQSRRSNVDAAKNKGEIDYGDAKKDEEVIKM